MTNWGNITCSISSAKLLTCTASGSPVTVSAATGTFDVSILVTPSQNGAFTSPRASGACQADPSNAIVESDETNNDCRSADIVDPSRDAVAVYSSVDLGVTDVASPDPNVVAGSLGGADNLTHTLTLTNHGPDPTIGATVTIDFGTEGLPAGVQLASATPSAGSYDAVNGIWTVGSLANNAQATLTLTFSVPTGTADGSTVTTNATVSNSDDFINDPDSSDDNASRGHRSAGQRRGADGRRGAIVEGLRQPARRHDEHRPDVHDHQPRHRDAEHHVGRTHRHEPGSVLPAATADTCSNQAIQPGQSCTRRGRLYAATTGAQTANLEITSDAPSSPTEIVLHGSGTQSVISASPSSASFGNENVNRTSASQSFRITNNGTATLHIGLATLGGQRREPVRRGQATPAVTRR